MGNRSDAIFLCHFYPRTVNFSAIPNTGGPHSSFLKQVSSMYMDEKNLINVEFGK